MDHPFLAEHEIPTEKAELFPSPMPINTSRTVLEYNFVPGHLLHKLYCLSQVNGCKFYPSLGYFLLHFCPYRFNLQANIVPQKMEKDVRGCLPASITFHLDCLRVTCLRKHFMRK